MELVAIAAVAANGVIGRNGTIPWHHPEDLRRFKRLTTGHPVIMGRLTYESILERLGEPLPDRTTIVLSETLSASAVPAAVEVVRSPEAAVERARALAEERAFVAGGAAVYEALLPRCDRLLLTELQEAHEGDTHFPSWDEDAWAEVDRESREAFDWVEYRRRG